MKIQINATGKIEDIPLNIAQRKINKGIAHIVKEEIKLEKYIEKIGEPIIEPPEEIKIEIGELEELAEPIEKTRKARRKKKDEDKVTELPDWENSRSF